MSAILPPRAPLSVTTKGQVTVPVHIRRKLGLKPGDRVHFREERGRVYLEPEAAKVSDLFGIIKTTKTATLAQLRAAVAEGMGRVRR